MGPTAFGSKFECTGIPPMRKKTRSRSFDSAQDDSMDGARRIDLPESKKADTRPAFLLSDGCATRYVVERGLTTMAVAGTMAVPGFGPEYVQPRSVPPLAMDVQAGRLGLICCVSALAGLVVTRGTLM